MATLIGASHAIVVGSPAAGRCGPLTGTGTWPYVLDNFNRTVGPQVMTGHGNWLGTASSGAVWSQNSLAALQGTTTGGVNGSALYLTTTWPNGDLAGGSAISIPFESLACGASEVFMEFRWQCTADPTSDATGFGSIAVDLCASAASPASAKVSCSVYFTNDSHSYRYQSEIDCGVGPYIPAVILPHNTYAFASGTWYRTKLHFKSGVQTQMATWLDGGAFPGWQLTQSLSPSNTMSVYAVNIFAVNATNPGGTPVSFLVNLIQFDQS